jgi:hypothetical protein
MSPHDEDLIERLHTLAGAFEMPAAPPAEDVRRGRRRVRRNRGFLGGAVAAAAAVVLGATAALGALDRAEPDSLRPAERPGAADAAVWYDASGLHRGDVVEQTPVVVGGVLALVRSGAVYSDAATGDVWFHPWGGDPRVVGQDSAAGPGGDPNGDTAAWFEGSDALNGRPGELVVYDTAAGREISRTMQSSAVTMRHGDHRPVGNGFLQVSAQRVLWTSTGVGFSHDVRTRSTSRVKVPKERTLEDVHDDIEVLDERGSSLVLRVPGRAEQRYPDLESVGRLSSSGHYLLAVEGTTERHAAVIIDTRTGELWPAPGNDWPRIAWSYGDIALMDTDDALLACDAERRSCERLQAERSALLPNN